MSIPSTVVRYGRICPVTDNAECSICGDTSEGPHAFVYPQKIFINDARNVAIHEGTVVICPACREVVATAGKTEE